MSRVERLDCALFAFVLIGLAIFICSPHPVDEYSKPPSWIERTAIAALVGGPGFFFLWKFLFPFEWTLRPEASTAPKAPSSEGVETLHATLGLIAELVADGFQGVGRMVAVIAALVTFAATYIGAAVSTGWVIGLALGWIPAGLAAVFAYVVFRYFWWLMLLGAVLVIRSCQG